MIICACQELKDGKAITFLFIAKTLKLDFLNSRCSEILYSIDDSSMYDEAPKFDFTEVSFFVFFRPLKLYSWLKALIF